MRLAVVATSMTAAARSGSRARGQRALGMGDGQGGDRTPAGVPYACADRGDATFALAQVGRLAAATDGGQLAFQGGTRLPAGQVAGVERAELLAGYDQLASVQALIMIRWP